MGFLRRYDLASDVAKSFAWEIFALNVGEKWATVDEAKEQFIDRVMETRPGLDRRKIRVMLLRMMRAENSKS